MSIENITYNLHVLTGEPASTIMPVLMQGVAIKRIFTIILLTD